MEADFSVIHPGKLRHHGALGKLRHHGALGFPRKPLCVTLDCLVFTHTTGQVGRRWRCGRREPGGIPRHKEAVAWLLMEKVTQGELTIAKPTSAFFSAGPSFVPSPVTATTCR